MRLLLLFMGCLALCAAQTTVSPPPLSSTETSAMTAAPLTVAPVLPLADPQHYVIAILQASVLSNLELNETTATPVLDKLHEIIRHLQPNITFSLSLKSIVEV